MKLNLTCSRIVDTFYSAVRRFRSDGVTAASAPLPPSSDSEKLEIEKPEESRSENIAHSSSPITVINQEDEVFEWREVIRGDIVSLGNLHSH